MKDDEIDDEGMDNEVMMDDEDNDKVMKNNEMAKDGEAEY